MQNHIKNLKPLKGIFQNYCRNNINKQNPIITVWRDHILASPIQFSHTIFSKILIGLVHKNLSNLKKIWTQWKHYSSCNINNVGLITDETDAENPVEEMEEGFYENEGRRDCFFQWL